MHQPRIYQPRFRFPSLILLALITSIVFYVFYVQLSEDNHKRELFAARCKSELSSVKYQLQSVLKYKKTMDNVMSEIQQDCTIQKQSVKDFYDNYILMKRHLEICELQTETLEAECKELKENLEKINAELAVCKKAPG